MGWYITLGILVFLAVLPLGVRIRYNAEGFWLKVILGPIKITLIPRPRKEKKEKKKQEPQKKEAPKEDASLPKPPQPPKAPKEKKPKEEKGGSVLDFLPFVQLALDLLGDFRRKLRVDELYVKLILAGGDPCDLAVNYGKTWAAVGNLLPVLDRIFVIKKRDIQVECDFTEEKTLVIARMDLTITLGRLLALIAVYAVRGLKEFLNFKKKRKGGAVT